MQNRAAEIGHQRHGAGAAGGPFQLQHHLSAVDFRHNHAADLRCDGADELFGKRPDRFELDQARLDAFFAGIGNRLLGGPGADAVGNHHNLGVVQIQILRADDLIAIIADFSDQPADHLFLGFGVHDRIAAFIMRQTRHMDAVAFPAGRHWGDTVVVRFIRLVVFARHRRFSPVDDFDFFLAGNHHPFIHMANHFIGHNQNGNSEILA